MSNLSSYVQTSFLGGEISQSAQGRLDLPAYKVSLNVCYNAMPLETGAWARRAGSRHVAATRGAGKSKVITFNLPNSPPYVMVFSDLCLRFTNGPSLVMTNDSVAVSTMSSATPAQVATTTVHPWSTGNTVVFSLLGASNPILQNRQFVITVTGTNLFTLADAITGAPIDGSLLNNLAPAGAKVSRVLEITTNYNSGSWASLRSVQAESRTALLNGTKPQVLQVTSQPTAAQFASFSLGAANFIDGPYLDPVPGSYMTSSALNGVVTLTLSFAAYDATRAYNIGDFVTDVGIGYKSIAALNQANTPAISPTKWTPVNAGAAVNGGTGFVSSDIGRLVRLLSEPALWNPAATYVAKDVVAYPEGNGVNSYWTATGAVAAGIQPGTSTLWAVNATGAIWTWAQVTAVSGSGLIAPATAIGSLTSGGGLAAAFDSNTSKSFASSAAFTAGILTYPPWSVAKWTPGSICQYNGVGYQATITIYPSNSWQVWDAGHRPPYVAGSLVFYPGTSGVYYALSDIFSPTIPPANPSQWLLVAVVNNQPPPATPTIWGGGVAVVPNVTEDVYIGQHYGAPQAVQSATLYPTSDYGLANNQSGMTVNLRAKATAPASPSDGALLGSTGGIPNTTSPITIASNDAVTTWNYIWFEVVSTYVQPLPDDGSHSYTARIGAAQAQFFAPTTSNGSVITAQIRGPALLYVQTIRIWRLGVYSDTTGWPTCGTYHEGRTWFGGVVPGRFDACVSNGFVDVKLDFTPTGPDGTVSGNNAISYICTGEEISQFLWMAPDQQGILCGTKSGEWLISAPAQGPLSQINIKAVRVTKVGCANIEPRRGEHTLLIVQRFARKIVEYFADVFSGKFSAPNLSERAKHLTSKGIAEIAYQQELTPTIWVRRSDGGLIGATYKRDTLTTSQGPNIIGWHRHQLGSGRLVESICVGPSVTGALDALTMITNDPVTGIRHIEVMTDQLDEGFALTDCWYLDDAIIPGGVAQAAPIGGPYGSALLTGLSMHEGKTVTAWIAGLDCGDYPVVNGCITVPFGDGVAAGTAGGLFTASLQSVARFATYPAVVGFTYNSDGQLVRPALATDVGTQAGPPFAKLGRFHRVGFQVYGAVNGSLQFGTDFAKLDPMRIRRANDVPYTVQEQFSGILRQEPNSTIDYDGMVAWRFSRPYPGFITVVGPFGTKADS